MIIAGLCETALSIVMAGLVPPARPKPLRRREGPAIYVSAASRDGCATLQRPSELDPRDEERLFGAS
ncbi:hypothetical protein SSBR45G_50130 [Bradyrhizobium sp. SSBR45G]|nr:hypothetical protein SSBR45G_50130 [Bradyrhizobium sp. SSBR45G]GLH87587.1 hypothetical protein SSBR45R_50470 [Bradyrhizobium sp. SSBR45R]